MLRPAIPESPTARLLLQLAAQGASCSIALGERTLLLRDGDVVDIEGAAGDNTLLTFLVAAGRIDDRERAEIERWAQQRGVSIDQPLHELASLDPEVLRDTRRALLLERLVRALASHEASGAPLPEPEPCSPPIDSTRFDTTELVLDALARRAAFGSAEAVGRLRRARFVWLDVPAQKRAATWAELGDIPHAISAGTLFPRHPAAPSRIAALVAAGVAQLDVSGATSSPSLLPVGAEPRRTSAAPVPTGPLGIAPIASWLPAVQGPLADPLLPLEAQIAELAANGAPPYEQASGWLALAEAWFRELGSLAEAARAAREAAAADPSDARALASAATWTAAAGAPELAYAYARAWAEQVEAEEEQAEALAAAAEYARRAGRAQDLLDALRAAVDCAPVNASLQEQLARVLAQRGEVQAAVEHARRAAEIVRVAAPERARALLTWAAQLAPSNLRTWNDLAKNLVRGGRARAGIAVLAEAARGHSDRAVRERLRHSAVAFAELAGGPELASEIMLETLDGERSWSEAIATNLRAAQAWAELAAVARGRASQSSGSERATLLTLAAEAQGQLPGGEQEAFALLSDALTTAPALGPSYEALRELAARLEQPQEVIDALERALRAHAGDHAAIERLGPATREQLLGLLGALRGQLAGVQAAPLERFAAECLAELEGAAPEPEEARMREERLAQFEQAVTALDHELRAAPRDQRTAPALALAALCRHDPARRAFARRLYEKVLEREPQQTEALAGLESLLRLSGDDEALCALAAWQTQVAPSAATYLVLARRELRAGRPERAREAVAQAAAYSDAGHEARVLAWRFAVASGELGALERSLHELARHASSARARAHALMRLALAERKAGRREQAADAADTALASDPECAEAALLLVADIDLLAPERRLPALRSARAVLGDTPELLRQLARACFAAADPQGQREALLARLALLPRDDFAARALLALQTTGRDVEALSEALYLALSPPHFSAPTLYVAQSGLTQLATLSSLERAVEIVLTASDQLGEQARPLLAWALGQAQELAVGALHGQLLERAIAQADRADQPAALRELAALLSRGGPLWAEARCQLRLLALMPNDQPALERLAALYAETGEGARLEAVLTVLEERAANEHERRRRRFDRALCALYTVGDAERAASLVEEALVPAQAEAADAALSTPLEAWRQGLGLLRAGAPEQAFKLLLKLAERAPSPLSRDLLDEAIAIAGHDLGQPNLTLRAAAQGVLHHPDHEPFMTALERSARAAGELEPLLTTLEQLAEQSSSPERKAELLLRAATLSEDELQDPARACALLDRAYHETPTDEVEALVLACAERLFARDVRAGKEAYDRLRDTLHVRAKFGEPLARARALTTLARLAHDTYLAREDALRYLEAAQASLSAADQADAETAERVRGEISVLAIRIAQSNETVRPLAGRSAAQRRSLQVEVELAPSSPHGAPTLRPHAGSVAPPASAAPAPGPALEAQPPLTSLTPVAIRSAGVSESPAPSQRPAAADARAVERAREPEQLVVAVAAGDTAALKALSELLQRDYSLAHGICVSLLARAREQGFNVCALRGLRHASASMSDHAVWRTSSQALAYLDPLLRPPPSPTRRSARGPVAAAALAAARATAHGAALALLAQVVEAAAPLFRRPQLAQKEELEPLREPPHTQLLTELGQIFDVRYDAYLARSGEDCVELLSVQPPSILVGDRTPRDLLALRFRLARAFEYARPENVLLATLTSDSAETLLAALFAAFGPADAQRSQVSRDAATLAAELWRTVPAGAQRTLTRLVAAVEQPLALDTLATAVQLRGARVALFATRDLELALGQLGRDGDGADARVGRSEAELDHALAHQPLVSGLVSYAFGDAYLRSLGEGLA